ncbi:MAG: hypothetical protein LBI04_12485 [Treponema sp.]|nr:hypothetical protein [Treponema sp.]
MHTVIITDPDTTSKFAKHQHLFAPFLIEHGGSICHCTWHKGGADIDKAVPELYPAIKNHPEWRAIILVHSSQEDLYDPNNPFDFKCNHRINEGEFLLKDNPEPLVSLTHMLAGLPSLGVKGYETGYVSYNEKTGAFKECTYKGSNQPILRSHLEKYILDEANKKAQEYRKKGKNVEQGDWDEFRKDAKNRFIAMHFKGFENRKPKVVEVPYSPDEKAKYKELTGKYAFKENRPVEVLLLSIREQYASDDREETMETVQRAWKFHDEADSSDFWKVYANTCRFLCYDLINTEHTLYSRELWRFFLLTLTLAANQFPSDALQAYHLYKADLQIDSAELGRVYGSYLENLVSFQRIVKDRMSRVSKLTQDKKKELVPAQHISVNFSQIEEGDVKAKSDKIGLSGDCPVSEARFWHEHIQGTRQTIENILSAPQEIVAEKALETRRTIDIFTGKEQVLDRFQVDRIRKRIDELESQIMNTELYSMLDTDTYKAEVAKAGDAVSKYIKIRITKRNVLLVSLGSMLVFFCGFIPYLINSAKFSRAAFGAAFGLVVIALILLAAGALLTLWFLRRKLIKKIKAYNKDVETIFERIKKSAPVFSGYLSDICTYMYARSLLSGVILKKDNDNSVAAKLKAHLVYMESEIERDKTICSLYGLPLDAFAGEGSFINIDDALLEEWPSECRFYELPPCMEKNTMKLLTSPIKQQTRNILTANKNNEWHQNETGITLDAPYSFIAGINLVREELYDRREGA